MNPSQIQITLHTTERISPEAWRQIVIAHECCPDETVDHLVQRLLDKMRSISEGDHIEIRLAEPLPPMHPVPGD